MAALAQSTMQSIWFDKQKVEDAEYKYQEYLVKQKCGNIVNGEEAHGVAKQIADAREKIQQTLRTTQKSPSPSPSRNSDSSNDKVALLEKENKALHEKIEAISNRLGSLESRISALEAGKPTTATAQKSEESKPAAAPAKLDDSESESDDDVDLFGSDSEEDEAAAEIRKKRLEAYAEKKKKKPGPIAKSNIILDIKPWDDETDMVELEKLVRSIEKDGLLWGSAKLAEVAYGIKKLVISCVVEDEKVGTDFLEDEITKFEDFVQSVDIAAFNKI